ncbi:MAG: heparan-alpha-glucosaminide N-acetyltransferase domain-containing protein [Polyangia bacterium]
MVIFQVLYAIGMSLVCMAFLRRLSSRALLAGAVAIQLFGELTERVHFDGGALRLVWAFLFVGGRVHPPIVVAYPLVPWLSIMMAGWVLGRWLLETRDQDNATRGRTLALIGVALLAVFAVVRGVDGYGNWGLFRDSLAPLQWLHVAKYPPSLSYTTLELGLTFLLLALFFQFEGAQPRPLLQPFLIFG